MIGSIRGSVIIKNENSVIVETTGVGYLIFLTPKNIDRLALGETYFLHIYSSVKETAFDLFGFLTATEKEMFATLMNVTGIGPKSALGILESADTETLVHAIKTDDAEYLTKMGGIGKKTAEKIVHELKGKALPVIDGTENVPEADDALLALEALGYSLAVARDTLRAIDPGLDTRAKVREALRLLSNSK